MVLGYSILTTASMSADGVQLGDIIGTNGPIIFGLWETIRNEFR